MQTASDHSRFVSDSCTPYGVLDAHTSVPKLRTKSLLFSIRFNLPLSVLGAQSGAFGGHESKLETAMNTVRFQHEMQVAGGNKRRVHVVSERVVIERSVIEHDVTATEQKIFHRQIELARALRDYLH